MKVKKMTLHEVLQQINNDVSLLKTVYKFSAGSALSKVFRYAFVPECKFELPEGVPPYTPCTNQPGDTPSDLLVVLVKNRLEYLEKYMDVSSIKREMIFIRLLETVHPTEAKILLAIKDQKLFTLYPNITPEVLIEAGYLEMRDDYPRPFQVSSQTTESSAEDDVEVEHLEVPQTTESIEPLKEPEEPVIEKPKTSTKKPVARKSMRRAKPAK